MSDYLNAGIISLIAGAVTSVFLLGISRLNIWGAVIILIINLAITASGVAQTIGDVHKANADILKGISILVIGISSLTFDSVITFNDHSFVAQSLILLLILNVIFNSFGFFLGLFREQNSENKDEYPGLCHSHSPILGSSGK